MQAVPEYLADWLKTFSKAVRERDFAVDKKLFDDRVTAFGTFYSRLDNREELAERQWQVVWPKTVDFDFDYATARAVVTAELATIITGWRSVGNSAGQKSIERLGRATLVLQKSADGWKAVHTHFSINPHPDHDPVLRHA